MKTLSEHPFLVARCIASFQRRRERAARLQRRIYAVTNVLCLILVLFVWYLTFVALYHAGRVLHFWHS